MDKEWSIDMEHRGFYWEYQLIEDGEQIADFDLGMGAISIMQQLVELHNDSLTDKE